MYKAIIVILICWLVVSVTMAWRIETYGACASSSCTKTLLYTQQHYHSNPALLRLTNSYKSWALGLIGTDAGNYLRTALSIAEGKGMADFGKSINRVSADVSFRRSYTCFVFSLF